MIKPWYDVAGVILLCSLFVFAAYQFIQEVCHLQATTNRLILESKSDSTPIIFFPDKTKRKGFSVNKAQERQRVAAAKRILKCKAEFNRKYRPSDKAGAWYESGKDHSLQFIVNNYCGVILTKGYSVSGLPEINEEQKTIDLYEYYSNALNANHLDVTEFVPDLKALREYEKIVRSQNEYYKLLCILGIAVTGGFIDFEASLSVAVSADAGFILGTFSTDGITHHTGGDGWDAFHFALRMRHENLFDNKILLGAHMYIPFLMYKGETHIFSFVSLLAEN